MRHQLIRFAEPLLAVQVGHKYDVFLSHVGDETGQFVGDVHGLLEDGGNRLSVFWDKWCLVGSPDTKHDMEQAAKTSPVGVVILSPSSFTKEWPLHEMALISSSGRALVPVLVGMDLSALKAQLAVPPSDGTGSPASREVVAHWAEFADKMVYTEMVIQEPHDTEAKLRHVVAHRAILKCCMINVLPAFAEDHGDGAKAFLVRTLKAAIAVRNDVLFLLEGWQRAQIVDRIGGLEQLALDKRIKRAQWTH